VDESRSTFVERLFAQHGALQAFFRRRLRGSADAADFVQEVYLRMLRVSNPDEILNPEGYLFTVAANLLKEMAAAGTRTVSGLSAHALDAAQAAGEFPRIDTAIDAARRVDRLQVVLNELPPNWSAAVILRYRHELSHQEIAQRLEVSPRMVKKYLAQALNLCRRRMARLR
jgi:RNA polymerase sigma-70 factor (ECF subfamily)